MSERRFKYNKVATLTKRKRKELGVDKHQAKAVAKYVRISPRKVALVLDLIRGKAVSEAIGMLKFTSKSPSAIIYKLLNSAVANAVNNNYLNEDRLYVAEAFADQGPTLKRIMPRARGSAYRIRKRSSHITIVVKEKQ